MAGVGVERVFNYARDICHYRRGKLKPATIRSSLLMYYYQLTESRVDTYRSSLKDTININSMSDKDIEIELQQRIDECRLQAQVVSSWDEDHFISDTEDNIPARTRRAELQREFRIRSSWRRDRLGVNYVQELSYPVESPSQSRLRPQIEPDDTVWDIPSSEERELSRLSRITENSSSEENNTRANSVRSGLNKRRRI